MKVVIVGAGNMGLAMAKGLKSSGFSVTLASRANPKLQYRWQKYYLSH